MIEVKGIKKSFGKNEVLKGIDFSVKKGDIVTVLGPSGSGKSTLLRCINFLETADAGFIRIGDDELDLSVHRKKEEILRLRRHTAMVFQNYNLFQNKTVLHNVMEALIVVRKLPVDAARAIALQNLEKVGLTDKNDEYPSFLSGGQQQRVGIARALALNPDVILLDEPTSSLDPELVGGILECLKNIAKEGITMIVVTHEISFAMDIANHIIFLDGGLIEEEGQPKEVLLNPKSERTRQFLERVTRKWYYSI